MHFRHFESCLFSVVASYVVSTNPRVILFSQIICKGQYQNADFVFKKNADFLFKKMRTVFKKMRTMFKKMRTAFKKNADLFKKMRTVFK